MRSLAVLNRCAAAALAVVALLALGARAGRAEVPPYMNLIVGQGATTKAESALGYYDQALAIFQRNHLAQRPVLLAPFSPEGGLLARIVSWGAHAQVEHCMGVVEGWKQMRGPSWNTTCAVSNSIYVAVK